MLVYAILNALFSAETSDVLNIVSQENNARVVFEVIASIVDLVPRLGTDQLYERY